MPFCIMLLKHFFDNLLREISRFNTLINGRSVIQQLLNLRLNKCFKYDRFCTVDARLLLLKSRLAMCDLFELQIRISFTPQSTICKSKRDYDPKYSANSESQMNEHSRNMIDCKILLVNFGTVDRLTPTIDITFKHGNGIIAFEDCSSNIQLRSGILKSFIQLRMF